MQTPWGRSDSEYKHAEGIIRYSTPRHGGFRVSPELNKLIPEKWRLKGRFSGWYEEDCGWAPLLAVFPLVFEYDGEWVERVRPHLPEYLSVWEGWVARQNAKGL